MNTETTAKLLVEAATTTSPATLLSLISSIEEAAVDFADIYDEVLDVPLTVPELGEGLVLRAEAYYSGVVFWDVLGEDGKPLSDRSGLAYLGRCDFLSTPKVILLLKSLLRMSPLATEDEDCVPLWGHEELAPV